MAKDFRLLLNLFIVLLTGIFTSCKGQEQLTKPSCECVNYNNEYMNCSCCPSHVTTDINYSIQYSWSGSANSMQTCEKSWSSDHFIRCDCLLCGTIWHTKNHEAYNICKDMDQNQKPFAINRSYSLHVRAFKDDLIASANFTVEPQSVLKPAPVQILDRNSSLASENSVVIALTWKPHDFAGENLMYLISWRKQGDELFQNITTDENTIMLEDSISPNSVYDIIVICRPKQNGYWSDADEETSRISVRTVEKCYERTPSSLINYKANYSKCRKLSRSCVEISVFWQHLYPDSSWATCAYYTLEITGKSEKISQNVSCKSVMAVLEKPLFKNQAYNVSLRTISESCTSPPSHLIVQTGDGSTASGDFHAEVEKRNSSVTISISWLDKLSMPDKYGIFYCKEGTNSKCQEGVNEESVTRQPGNLTTFEMEDPGSGFVYNVVPYKNGKRTGLSPKWLCAFDYCGKLYKPEISITEVGLESITLKVAEDQLCLSTASRGLPKLYDLQVVSPEGATVFSKTFSGSAPVVTKVPSLLSSTAYEITVRSEGKCGEVESSTRTIATVGKGGKINVIGLIFGVILTISLVFGCVGFVWWCCKNTRKKQTFLEKHRSRLRALSSVSSTTMVDYTQRWLDNLPISDEGDYAECEGVENTGPDVLPRDVDGQHLKFAEDPLGPQQNESKCPKVFAKWGKKWSNVILCASKPTSPQSEGGERCDNSQRTPLTDPERGMVGSGGGKAEMDLTESELLSVSKEQTPVGDSGCVQESLNGKPSAKIEGNTVIGNEAGSVADPSTSMRDLESPPEQTISQTRDANEESRKNIDTASSDFNSPSQPSNENISKEGLTSKDSGPTSGSGLPTYTQVDGDGDYKRLPLELGRGDDYKELPGQNASDGVTDDNNLSDDDDDVDDDQSAAPFQTVIPSLAGGPFDIS